MTGGEDPLEGLRVVESAIRQLKAHVEDAERAENDIRSKVEGLREKVAALEAATKGVSEELTRQTGVLSSHLAEAKFEIPKKSSANSSRRLPGSSRK